MAPCSPSTWRCVSAHVGDLGASEGAPGKREDSNDRNRLVSQVSPALSTVASRNDRRVSSSSSRFRLSKDEVLGDGLGVLEDGRDGTMCDVFLLFFLLLLLVSKSKSIFDGVPTFLFGEVAGNILKHLQR